MKIEAIRKEREIATESMLRTQFKMEMIVYTQDSTYSKKLGKRKRENEQECATVSVFVAPLVKKSISSTDSNNDSGATLKEMIKHLKSYYQVRVIYITCILQYITHILDTV